MTDVDCCRLNARYASDVTDDEYGLIKPLLPPAKRDGRRRATDLREVLNAILYLIRTGCPWNMLPKGFPPKSTVYGYFRCFWQDGIWHRIWMILLMRVRERAGREASPTAGMVDSQSVKTTESGWLRGYDAGAGLRLEIVKRPPHAEGFEIIPRRWVIERTFGWLGRNRRLAKDFERLIETSTAMVVVAIIQLLVRRLANG